jgi:Flp pilus assembly protein TadD
MFETNRIASWFFLVLFSSCCVFRVTAQGIPPGSAATDTGFGGSNTIGGMILVPNGTRAEHRISVRLQTMTRGDRVTASDEYGNFVFRGVPSGEYTIVIDREKDFEPYVQNVSVIQPRGMPPQIYNLSVRLVPKSVTPTKPGVINAELANVPKNALVHYNKAAELAKNKDQLQAIEELKLAIKEYPSFAIALNELGVQYLRLNKLEEADQAFQDTLKIEPSSVPALVNRGIANVLMKRYGEAVPILRKAIAKDESSAVGHYFLGQAMANLGLFADAEKELQRALQLGNDEMNEARRLLAIIYTNRGDKKLAADELEAYLKLAPNASDADQLRSKILELRGTKP